MKKRLTLANIANIVGGEVVGNGSLEVDGLADLKLAGSNELSFLADKKYLPFLNDTQAAAVLIAELDDELEVSCACIIVADPYLAYARVSQLFDLSWQDKQGIHPSAFVDDSASVSATAWVGPKAIVDADAIIEDGAQVGAGSYVGERTTVGAYTRLSANVSLYHDVIIGKHCVIHSGAVIGSDGFGFAPNKSDDKGWVKIHQLGRVVLEDDVEVGANTAIDRGALQDTLIRNGVKLDNLVHLAHNVVVGERSAIAANSAIAGSTTIGSDCTVAGCVGINGHINITDNVHFTGMTMVTASIDEPGVYSSGVPFSANRQWRKNAVRFTQLDELAKRVKKIEKLNS